MGAVYCLGWIRSYSKPVLFHPLSARHCRRRLFPGNRCLPLSLVYQTRQGARDGGFRHGRACGTGRGGSYLRAHSSVQWVGSTGMALGLHLGRIAGCLVRRDHSVFFHGPPEASSVARTGRTGMDFYQSGSRKAAIAQWRTLDCLAGASPTQRPAAGSSLRFRQSFNVCLLALAACHDPKCFRTFSHPFNHLLGPALRPSHGHDPHRRTLFR